MRQGRGWPHHSQPGMQSSRVRILSRTHCGLSEAPELGTDLMLPGCSCGRKASGEKSQELGHASNGPGDRAWTKERPVCLGNGVEAEAREVSEGCISTALGLCGWGCSVSLSEAGNARREGSGWRVTVWSLTHRVWGAVRMCPMELELE